MARNATEPGRRKARGPGRSFDCGKNLVVEKKAGRFKLEYRSKVTESAQISELCGCPEYASRYRSMQRSIDSSSLTDLQRAYRGEYSSYTNGKYNKRGIYFDREHLGDFRDFLLHMGPRPTNESSVDRIDNGRGYEPGNIRWAGKKEQTENRRATKWISWDGVRYSRARFAAMLGIRPDRLRQQLARGWSVVRIVEQTSHIRDPWRGWQFDMDDRDELERLYRARGSYGKPRIDFLIEHLQGRLSKESRSAQRRSLLSLIEIYSKKRRELVSLSSGLEMEKTDQLLSFFDTQLKSAEISRTGISDEPTIDVEAEQVQLIAKKKIKYVYED
ncbi:MULTISPECIES: hypothetical protein [Stenotrophomonas]|uniref:hypothetical protein n=1 Tax=Stenotrophomonas TaxID=40323 RepID=UPI000ACD9610|nr:hypothetical protein [Stenotrophomonas maltophilia]HEL3767626.1 hypothetical protein [Stenotrophomonas maltophilia]